MGPLWIPLGLGGTAGHGPEAVAGREAEHLGVEHRSSPGIRPRSIDRTQILNLHELSFLEPKRTSSSWGRLLVACIDQLEEEVGPVGGDREVADLVDNEETRLPEVFLRPLFS